MGTQLKRKQTMILSIQFKRMRRVWLGKSVSILIFMVVFSSVYFYALPMPAFAAALSAAQNILSQRKLDQIISQSQGTAVIGIAAESGNQTLYAANADTQFLPASTLKLFTSATALHMLGPNFTVSTGAYAAAKPSSGGVIRGDLTLYGAGDPNLSLTDLAAAVAASGVRSVDGNIVGNESYFSGPAIGNGWESSNLQYYYGAEISALSYGGNIVTITVTPAKRQNTPPKITVSPDLSIFKVLNLATTRKAQSGQSQSGASTQKNISDSEGISVTRNIDSNVFTVGGFILPSSGSLASGSVKTFEVPVHDPGLFAAAVFQTMLLKRGISVSGHPVSSGYAGSTPVTAFNPQANVLIGSVQSEPLSQAIIAMNKQSINLDAELWLRQIGRAYPKSGQTSDTQGISAIMQYVQLLGVNPAGLRIVDGSGLSAEDLITPKTTTQFLAAILSATDAQGIRNANALLLSLPVAGVDGTLKYRLQLLPPGVQIDAKTGTLDAISALAGIVQTRTKRIVFSVYVGNIQASTDLDSTVDAIGAALAKS